MKAIGKFQGEDLPKILRSSPYFRGVPGKLLEEMAPFFRETSFAKGGIILKENSRARHLFILSKGKVALSTRRGAGELVTEIVKKKGNLFGWSALVPPRRYTSTAKALENSRVLSIAGKDMEGLLKRYPSFGLLFLQRLSSVIATRLYHTRSLLAETLA